MAQGYYIVHLEDDKERENIIAELRYFAYAGCFASCVHDSFLLSEYDLQPTMLVSNWKGLSTRNANTSDIVSHNGKYSEMIAKCTEIFLKRNPNLSAEHIH